MTTSIQLVLFDVGNVIIRSTHEITHAILRDYGVPYTTAVRYYVNDDYPNFARGRMTGDEFGERTRERIGGGLTVEELRYAHDHHMYAVDRGTIDVLRLLRERGIARAVATDTNEWQTARERQLVDFRAPHFDNVREFRSNELGALKADGGVFERILAEIDEDPAHVLFVDDSPEKVARAAALGMPTIRFESAAQLHRALIERGLLDAKE
ncbi:MAG: HAD-IA family hydrolase [bacterium]|nr:HAD-IA family hydrolase [bacterium]